MRADISHPDAGGTIRPRPDFERLKLLSGETRTTDRLIAHYQLERSLASQILRANASERAVLYGQLYSHLFAELPDHPQNRKRAIAPEVRVSGQMGLIRPHVDKTMTFVEIGCGDAALSATISAFVKKSIGVDVTEVLVPNERVNNFEFLKTDGVNLNLPDGSVDFVFSNQLMEHLHPDDAVAQLREIRRVLKTGGKYLCITPSRLTGPHDISRYFDYTATGFHLKEYDYREMRIAFTRAGFCKFSAIFFARSHQVRAPYALARIIELCFGHLPPATRVALGSKGLGLACFAMACMGTR